MGSEIQIGIITGSIGVFIGVSCLVAAWIYWRKQWSDINRLLSIPPGQLQSGKGYLKETLDGKAYQKLLDLYQRIDLEQGKANKEKEAVKSYVADISHQMKTPLANLSLYSELLLEEELTDEERQFIEKLFAETHKMKWLVANLTQIARLESGAIAFDISERPLQRTIDRARQAVEGLIKEKDITVECHDIPDMWLPHDEKWTAEAFANILENAVKYQPEHTKIEIWAEVLELYVRIHVKDEGPGIAKKDYNKIFKRFYRGSNVREKAGSGLGLYLSQLILNRQKGYILVKSEPGKGSCFMVYLHRNG